jgi:hypothetical protein
MVPLYKRRSSGYGGIRSMVCLSDPLSEGLHSVSLEVEVREVPLQYSLYTKTAPITSLNIFDFTLGWCAWRT